MNDSRRLFAMLALSAVLALTPAATYAADVLHQVPNNALGFIVVNNLTATDAKVDQLIRTLHQEYPSPLAFLKAVTGISEGLDPQGDLLLAALPADAANKTQPQFCVWLPISDYDLMLKSLGGVPREKISTVRVADEDLLIARRGDWALVMDPDQRPLLEQILATDPNPPAIFAKWKDWIDAHDVAAVALADGILAALVQAASAGGNPPQPDDEVAELLGATDDDEDALAALGVEQPASTDFHSAAHQMVRKWIVYSPKLRDMIRHADAVGCAVRLDESGNAFAGVRTSTSQLTPTAETENAGATLPPALYRSGGFVANGAGSFPQALRPMLAEIFTRYVVGELKTEHVLVADEKTVARFQEATESALAEVTSIAVLTHPGEKSDGLYTNDYLVVRTPSAKSFVDRAGEVMRLWNKMNRDAEGEFPLIFDVEEQKIAGRDVIQYPTDVLGGSDPAVPEVRKVMEQFFGPGGKLRLWIAPVDDQTVLLAAATEREVTAALELLDQKQPIRWNVSELDATNKLLPEQSDWRLFFSPHDYHRWARQLSEVMTGPVIGARRSNPFPPSPPIGIAGGISDNELWLDVAAPAETIQNAGSLLKK